MSIKNYIDEESRRLNRTVTQRNVGTQTSPGGKARSINLAVGEPYFETPEVVKEATVKAIQNGAMRCTDHRGLPTLREAIAGDVNRRWSSDVTSDHVVVTSGGKQAVDHVIRAVLEPGDEAIVISPYFYAYPRQIELTHAKLSVVSTNEPDGFIPDPDRVAAAKSNRTRLLIVNSPCNPTGAVYPRVCDGK